jgi:hypothetical protein
MTMKPPIPTLALAATLLTTQAHAGPTVSTDLDLGTSTKGTPSGIGPVGPAPSPLYTVGFALRAGWRFDVAPVWFLPEIGGGYAVEQYLEASPTSAAPSNRPLGRLFLGGRIGWSGMLQPELRVEPSIFGHGGGAWYSAGASGSAFDVGLSLDLRIRRHLIVGAHMAYDVVTVYPQSPACTPMTVITPVGPETLPCPTSSGPTIADPWVSYGIHAGWLFW